MINDGHYGVELGILYILFQMIDTGLNDIPYVTLITIIGQVSVFENYTYSLKSLTVPIFHL